MIYNDFPILNEDEYFKINDELFNQINTNNDLINIYLKIKKCINSNIENKYNKSITNSLNVAKSILNKTLLTMSNLIKSDIQFDEFLTVNIFEYLQDLLSIYKDITSKNSPSYGKIYDEIKALSSNLFESINQILSSMSQSKINFYIHM